MSPDELTHFSPFVSATSPARTTIDLAAALPRLDALPTLDAALRKGVVDKAGLLAELDRRTGGRGIAQARELVALADDRAESPQESRARLICLDGGLPAPIPQFVVGTRRIDLGWPEWQLGLEYDSTEFHTGTALQRDRARHNELTARGWTMIYATASDIYGNPKQLVDRIRAFQGQHALSGVS